MIEDWEAGLEHRVPRPNAPTTRRVDFLGTPIDACTLEQAVAMATLAMVKGERLQHGDVNVGKFIAFRKDRELWQSIAESDLICADGMPIVWGCRLLDLPIRARVTGIDLMMAILEACNTHGFRPYFLGARQDVLERAIARVRERFPGLQIAGWHNGYFQQEEEPQIVAAIKATRADCLFVGISSPLKELFLWRNRDLLGVPLQLGVGGSFDVLAGRLRRAPQWMQRAGLEWMFRLIQEPRRLWKRYLTANTLYCGILAWAVARKYLRRIFALEGGVMQRESNPPRQASRTPEGAPLHTGMKKPLALSLLDQGVLSTFNFALNLLLIRLWPPELFGLFATALAVALICFSVQYSLVGTQLSVLRPRVYGQPDETKLLTTLWSANCVLMIALPAAVALGALCLGLKSGTAFAAALAIYVGGMLLREYARSLLFSEFVPMAVLQLDSLFVAVAVVGVSLLWLMMGEPDPGGALFVLGLASALAAVPFLLRRSAQMQFCLDATARNQYRNVWRNQSRWALLGAILYETMSRAHVFVVGAWFGVAAVGILQAGEMLFRPLGLLLQAWERTALPRFSALAGAARYSKAHALARQSLIVLLMAAVLFAGVLWGAWPWLQAHVFRASYADIGFVVCLWGAAAIVRLIAQVFCIELQGFGRFRQLSFIGLATSATAVALLVAVTLLFGRYEYSIVAVLTGNLVGIFLAVRAIERISQSSRSELSVCTGAYCSRWLASPGVLFARRSSEPCIPGSSTLHLQNPDRASPSAPVPQLISVCICTYRRQSLAQTLESIGRQRLAGGITCQVVVVDNDGAGFAQSMVKGFAETVPLAVKYVIQPNKGLSSARNTAIDSAQGEWLAFIDDDEVAAPDWLHELVGCALQFGADGVVGRVTPDYDGAAPAWVRRSGFFDRELPATGTPLGIDEALSGNALLRTSFLQAYTLRFDAAFNATGGEDTEFFRNFLDCGGRIVSAYEAVVSERVPSERTKGRYLTQRSLCIGEIHARVMHRGSPLRVVAGTVRAVANLAGASVLMLAALPRGREGYYRYYLAFARNIGKLRYYFGFQPIKMYE
jgi:N-acetylglucosaminyldiphosphoundecaprenol N-acetyl-beta-D-mannosaminyltransferase